MNVKGLIPLISASVQSISCLWDLKITSSFSCFGCKFGAIMTCNFSFASRKPYLRCLGRGFNSTSNDYSWKGCILVERTNVTTSRFMAIFLNNPNCSPLFGSKNFVKGCLLIMLGITS